MYKILINASNLHLGGSVQVAASFILDSPRILASLPTCELVVFVSSAVDANLMALGFDRGAIDNYRVLDVYGLEALRTNIGAQFEGFDLVFTIFGPLYLAKTVLKHIVGFAQPWIVYPDNEVASRLPFSKRLLRRLKYTVQWKYFETADRLVVEAQHVKQRLVDLKSFPADRIDVVSNCVAPIYFDDARWAQVPTLHAIDENVVRLGYVTRDYPHKNLDFVGEVARELAVISDVDYRFYVTLTASEWKSRNAEFKQRVFNVGAISIAQCPTFYQTMNGVFFPSLLECFSATPLEALAMRRALFASDRRFVRDVCSDYALYFDPTNARQAAKTIDQWFARTADESRVDHIDRAHRYVLSLPTSEDRSSAYIEMIRRQAMA